MKRLFLLFPLSLLLIALCAVDAKASVTIVFGGKSTFTIVVPSKAPASVTDAAAEMQRDIEKSSGAKLPIQRDDQKVSGAIISLGATQQAKAAGIMADGIADSGFRIVTKNGNLYIIGLDTAAKVNLSRKYYGEMTPQPDVVGPQYTKVGGWSNGTANGVYTFLEDYLGVRWLMPGKLGLDLRVNSIFMIPNLNRKEEPEFVYRNLIMLEKYTESIPAVADWQNHQKLGYSFRVNHQHNWEETVPADLYKEHPDWFAMIDGKRVKPEGRRYKLETTNPELVKYYAEKAIAALKADPSLNTYSLSPTDSRGYSESPESKALYDPSPSTMFDPESVPGAPSITPLILKFYRDVSTIIAKEYPQGKLAGYLYQDYLFPPKQGDMTLPKNFIPVIAPSFDYGYKLYRDDVRQKFDYVMNDWGKVAPPTWFYYDLPNEIMGPYSGGIVTPPGTGILNFIFPRLLKNHIKGTLFYGNTSWTNSAMTNYIDAKLLWNPKLDANDLQHEWLMRAYGPQAGTVMEDFYQKLDGWFADFYKKYDYYSYHAREPLFSQLYAPHYKEMEALFLKAKSQPMTDLQKQRLQLIEDNMVVLQWRMRNAGYFSDDFKSPLQRSGAQIADLMFDGFNARQTEDNAFDLFPTLWYQDQPSQTMTKVSLEKSPEGSSSSKVPNAGYIWLYAKQAGEVTLNAGKVDSGSAFIGYRVYEPKNADNFRLMQQGLFYSGAKISFAAKANSSYLVRITPQGFVSPKLDYTLSIPGAVMATAKIAQDTLYLQGKESPLYAFIPKGLDVIGFDNANGVTLTTQSPPDAARLMELQKRPGAKVLLNLDIGWKFHTQDGGFLPDYSVSTFDDSKWNSIDATDTWQAQGFPNYHGIAWYRKQFKLAAPTGKVLLYFGAVDGDAVVYVNGQKVGQHLLTDKGVGWDEPFSLDVTQSIKTGQNTIAVQVTKNDHASGIYNGVALLDE